MTTVIIEGLTKTSESLTKEAQVLFDELLTYTKKACMRAEKNGADTIDVLNALMSVAMTAVAGITGDTLDTATMFAHASKALASVGLDDATDEFEESCKSRVVH